jgi:hypothetical protein
VVEADHHAGNVAPIGQVADHDGATVAVGVHRVAGQRLARDQGREGALGRLAARLAGFIVQKSERLGQFGQVFH